MIGPATFTLADVEAERDKELQVTISPRDAGVSGQQHEVRYI